MNHNLLHNIFNTPYINQIIFRIITCRIYYLFTCFEAKTVHGTSFKMIVKQIYVIFFHIKM